MYADSYMPVKLFQFYKSTIITKISVAYLCCAIKVSILQKYDYYFRDFGIGSQVFNRFQFYKSTIITFFCTYLPFDFVVSILQKYDYYLEDFKQSINKKSFNSTKVRLLLALSIL